MGELEKRGYKVVWRTANGEAVSLNADVLRRAARRYEPGKPVEPAPGAGPLFVFGARDFGSAKELAEIYVMVIRGDVGCVEIWEADWHPWPGADQSAPGVAAQARLPVGTRLARQVILRRLVGRVRKGGWPRRPQWEKPDVDSQGTNR